MGIVFSVAYLLSSAIILLARTFFSARTQWVLLIAVTATVVGLAERLLQVWNYSLSAELGIYLPLLAMNALLLGGMQEYVLRQPSRQACLAALVMAVVVLLVCTVVGMLRGLAFLPVLHDASGLFLILALGLAGINALAKTGMFRIVN